jgi:predicted P-loop ATPase
MTTEPDLTADIGEDLAALERQLAEPSTGKVKKLRAIKPGPEPHGDWRDSLLYKRTRDGFQVDPVPANAITILRHDEAWAGVIAFDDFQQSIVTLRAPPWDAIDAPGKVEPGIWTAADTVRLQAWLRRRWTLSVGLEAARAALLVAAEAHRFSPVRDWLDGLRWDGQRRIGEPVNEDHPGSPSWLTTYLGAPDTPYVRTMGRWFLISAVARAYKPGCKVDTVPILEGPQGARKSTALRVLFSPWFSDTPLDLASKDRFVALRGVWGYELAEIDGYSKHDAAIIKAFVSSPRDDYRPPYAETSVRVERRCVFVGTVNPARDYLQDETGNRRFWPVRVGAITTEQLAALERDRETLWAEARELYQGHVRWWPEGAEEHALCATEQAERLARDPWEIPVGNWLAGRIISCTMADVLGTALGLDKSKWDDRAEKRAGRCLRAAGWQRVRDTSPDAAGHRGYHYERKTA